MKLAIGDEVRATQLGAPPPGAQRIRQLAERTSSAFAVALAGDGFTTAAVVRIEVSHGASGSPMLSSPRSSCPRRASVLRLAPACFLSLTLCLLLARPLAAAPGVVRDADNDGMEDAWETARGFSPASAADAAQDFDGDGASNLTEFRFGTDPKNVFSVPATTIAWIAGQPALQWNGVTHKRYQVQFSPNPATMSWVSLGTPLVGAGALLQFGDPVLPLPAARLYRLQWVTSFDRDRDGLDDWLETAVYGSNLNQASSSGSGIPDGWAVRYGFNPNTVTAAGNPDGDSANNLAEYTRGTDPTLADPPSGDATAKLRVFTPLNR